MMHISLALKSIFAIFFNPSADRRIGSGFFRTRPGARRRESVIYRGRRRQRGLQRGSSSEVFRVLVVNLLFLVQGNFLASL